MAGDEMIVLMMMIIMMMVNLSPLRLPFVSRTKQQTTSADDKDLSRAPPLPVSLSHRPPPPFPFS